ncbi:MAG: hypothetical protein WAK95_00780 [Desulfobacterales bacterium]
MGSKTPLASHVYQPFGGFVYMLSRKEFFKDLLIQAVRVVNDLAGEDEGCSGKSAGPKHEIDLPATELCPSLLAIEAEIRGVDFQEGRTQELRRAIYEKLAQNSPRDETESPQ